MHNMKLYEKHQIRKSVKWARILKQKKNIKEYDSVSRLLNTLAESFQLHNLIIKRKKKL